MSTIFKVTRRGTFEAEVDTHNQCGVKGTTRFDYTVVVEGKKLDEDNVLIEHFKLDDAIVKTFGTGKWQGTCEEFAGVIVGLVHAQIGDRADFVSVLLKPGHIAEISLEWNNYSNAASLPPAARRVDSDAGPLPKVAKKKKAKTVDQDDSVDYVPLRRNSC